MFERATITHTGIENGKINVGRIFDAMLYYNKVELICDARVFTGLWLSLGKDNTYSLLSHPTVNVTVTPEMPAIHNELKGFIRTHQPVYITASGREGNLIKPHETARSLHQLLSNNSDASLAEVKKLINKFHDDRYGKILSNEVKTHSLFESLIKDNDSMKLFLRAHAEKSGNNAREDLLDRLVNDVIKLPNGYMITSNIDLGVICPGMKI
jgi:hypothetical protein